VKSIDPTPRKTVHSVGSVDTDVRHRLVGSALFSLRLLLVLLGAVSGLLLLLPLPAHAAATSDSFAAPTLIVRVYDAFGARADELQRAREAVEAVFDATGVEVQWRQCSATGDDACHDRPASNELVIRLLRGTAASSDIPVHALGYSSVQTDHHQGTFATVYPDRVRRLAHEAGWHSGALLGNAIAHEVGHLLLGTTAHPEDGLMRPRWTANHTRHSAPDDWSFRDAERSDVRAAVSRRAPAPSAARFTPTPPVSAGDEPPSRPTGWASGL
jgi:hypothetical protein